MKIFHAKLLDDGIWIDGWIVKTIFKKVFLPFNPSCGFHYQFLRSKDKGIVWDYYSWNPHK